MSASTTVRISKTTHSFVQKLAARDHLSLQEVLDRALEAYRRERFLGAVNTAYGALRGDAQASKDLREEAAAWDRALGDGLERERPPARKRRPKR